MIFIILFILSFREIRNKVTSLSSLSFDEFVFSKDYVFIAAYSESCLYSRAAMPHFKEACSTLTQSNSNFECGKINLGKEVNSSLNVTEIPAFLLFENGKLKGRFKGVKSRDNLIQWAMHSIIRLPQNLSCEQLDNRRKRTEMGPFNVVLIMKPNEFDKTLIWKYAEASNAVYDLRTFVSNCTEGLEKEREFPLIASLSSFSEDVKWFGSQLEFSIEKMRKFFFDIRFHEIVKYEESHFSSLVGSGESVMILFLANETLNKGISEEFKNASALLLNKVRMAVAFPDKDTNSRKLASLVDQESPKSAFIAIFARGDQNELVKYVLDEKENEVTINSILKFYLDYTQGKSPYLRSQKLKKPLKWNTANYGRITGIAFDAEVLQSKGKDFLVLFCSKDISECGKAFDVIEDLAYELEHLRNLYFLIIDSRKNEVAGPPIFRVPLFRYYRGDSQEFIQFEKEIGEATIEIMRDFVRDNISVLPDDNEKENKIKEEL